MTSRNISHLPVTGEIQCSEYPAEYVEYAPRATINARSIPAELIEVPLPLFFPPKLLP